MKPLANTYNKYKLSTWIDVWIKNPQDKHCIENIEYYLYCLYGS